MRATKATLIWAWAAAAGVAVGSVLPWATVTIFLGTISVNGTSGDGALTLVAAVLAGVGAGIANRWLFAVPCFVAVAIMGYDAINIARYGDEYSEVASVDIGFGLLIGLAAAIGGSVLALIWPTEHRAPQPSVAPAATAYLTPPGWYAQGDGLRYWNGAAWTDHVAPPSAPDRP